LEFPSHFGQAGGAKADVSLVNCLRAIDVGVADHEAVYFLFVIVVVETERMAEFVEGDLEQAFGEDMFGGVVLGQGVDARCRGGKAKVGIAEEEIVTGRGDDVFFGNSQRGDFAFFGPGMGLAEENIGGDALPCGAEAGTLVDQGGLDDTWHMQGVGDGSGQNAEESFPHRTKSPNGHGAPGGKYDSLRAVAALGVLQGVTLAAVRAGVGVLHEDRFRNEWSGDQSREEINILGGPWAGWEIRPGNLGDGVGEASPP